MYRALKIKDRQKFPLSFSIGAMTRIKDKENTHTCTLGGMFDVSVFRLPTGEHNIKRKDNTEQDIQVSQQHMYPLYNPSVNPYDHDIALLHLQRPINFSIDVRPICIGPAAFTEALVKRASPATVSGWGRTRYLGIPSNTLHKVEVPYTGRVECKRTSSLRITPAMFCAGYYNEAKDACQGDSGGPHANKLNNTWFLTGIVSWGEECAKDGKYGVYTSVSLYVKWIHNMTHGIFTSPSLVISNVVLGNAHD